MPKGKGAKGMLGMALEADIEDVRQEQSGLRTDEPATSSDVLIERINITMPQPVLLELDDLVHAEKRKGNRGVSRSSMILEAVRAQYGIGLEK